MTTGDTPCNQQSSTAREEALREICALRKPSSLKVRCPVNHTFAARDSYRKAEVISETETVYDLDETVAALPRALQ